MLKDPIQDLDYFYQTVDELNEGLLQASTQQRKELRSYLLKLVESGQADPADGRNYRYFLEELNIKGNAPIPEIPSVNLRLAQSGSKSRVTGSPLNSQEIAALAKQEKSSEGLFGIGLW